MHAHSLAEWAQMVSLAISLHAAASAPYFLLVDAEVWAWPHPLTAACDRAQPALERGADRLLVEAVNARHTARDAALTVTALLMLLNPATPSESAR